MKQSFIAWTLLNNEIFIKFFFSKSTESLTDIFKLINYSCSQKPINDLHLGQVDESWYPMKHQMKHHQVFIWDETCFSSEIKHFHFNEIFIDYTTHGNNAIPVVNNNSYIWDPYWRCWTLILTEQLAKEELWSGPALTTSWALEFVKQLKPFSSEIFTSVALVLGPNT